MIVRLLLVLILAAPALAFVPLGAVNHDASVVCHAEGHSPSRRTFLGTSAALVAGAAFSKPQPAQAVGPVKIDLKNPVYTAIPCPKERPMPGQMAMKGMKGMCVTGKCPYFLRVLAS